MPYLRCEACGRTDIPRKGKGLCRNCYMKEYRRAHRVYSPGDLERFAAALPSFLKGMGYTGIAVRYEAGQVTLTKVGTKIKATWP